MRNRKVLVIILIISFILVGTLTTAQPATAAEANLSWGERGSAVTQLQQTLNNNGYWCGSTDGIFGSKTYNAVIKFQRDAGIAVDGIVGPQTRQALGLSSTNLSNPQVSRGSKTITVLATGYCPCSICNYPYGGQPSYLGYPLKRGIVAVDPKIIPMGSKLYIEGYGTGIAADQGGAIKGNHIDLCFSTHKQALDWGMRYVKVTVY